MARAGDSPAGQCNHGDAPPPWPVRRSAHGGVQVDGQRPFAGSRTSGPGPGQQLPAHPIQLADVAPPEAAQESSQGGWALTTQPMAPAVPPVRNTSASEVAPSQRRGHQGQQLVSWVRSPRRVSQRVAVDDPQAQVAGLGSPQPSMATRRPGRRRRYGCGRAMVAC